MHRTQTVPLQRWGALPEQVHAVNVSHRNNRCERLPDFPLKNPGHLHEYEPTSTATRCIRLERDNQRLTDQLAGLRLKLDDEKASRAMVSILEAKNRRLMDELLELKSRGQDPQLVQYRKENLHLKGQLALFQQGGGDAKSALIIEELRDELRQAARYAAGLNDEIVILKRGNGAQVELRSEISKLEKLLITSDMKREEAVLSAQREIDSLRKQLKKALDKIAEGGHGQLIGDLTREIEASSNTIEMLHNEVNALKADGLSLEQLGLGKQYRFDKRVYRVEPLVQIRPDRAPIDNGIAYRTEPDPAMRTKEGDKGHNCGPSNVNKEQTVHTDQDGNLVGPECIVADAIIQGPDGVYVRDSHTQCWIPLMQKLPQGGPAVPVLKHLGKEADLIARFDKPELGLISEDGKTGCINIADGQVKVRNVTSPPASP